MVVIATHFQILQNLSFILAGHLLTLEYKWKTVFFKLYVKIFSQLYRCHAQHVKLCEPGVKLQ